MRPIINLCLGISAIKIPSLFLEAGFEYWWLFTILIFLIIVLFNTWYINHARN